VIADNARVEPVENAVDVAVIGSQLMRKRIGKELGAGLRRRRLDHYDEAVESGEFRRVA